MNPIVHLAFGVALLSAAASHALAAGTNKLCNGRNTEIVFAVIHETSDRPDASCDLQPSGCSVALQGWYTLKPGVCTDVDLGNGWETYLSVFVKETAASPYRPEAFPVNESFYKDRNVKNSGVLNVATCMPVGAFKRKLPGRLAPLLNSAVPCAPGEALHPLNLVVRGAPDAEVVVTLNQ